MFFAFIFSNHVVANSDDLGVEGVPRALVNKQQAEGKTESHEFQEPTKLLPDVTGLNSEIGKMVFFLHPSVMALSSYSLVGSDSPMLCFLCLGFSIVQVVHAIELIDNVS